MISTRNGVAINVAPNPVTNNEATFQLYAVEPTIGELVIADLHGNVILRRENVRAAPDWPITKVVFNDVASGTFAAMLITPHGVGRATILKLP